MCYEIFTTKYFLQVPYEGKDDAKAQGAKWDADIKKWYTYDIKNNSFPILQN